MLWHSPSHKFIVYVYYGRLCLYHGLSLQRIHSPEVSFGHSYNLIDIRTRRILNIETASRNRISVREVGATPFFHANMYLHLPVQQVCIKARPLKWLHHSRLKHHTSTPNKPGYVHHFTNNSQIHLSNQMLGLTIFLM